MDCLRERWNGTKAPSAQFSDYSVAATDPLWTCELLDVGDFAVECLCAFCAGSSVRGLMRMTVGCKGGLRNQEFTECEPRKGEGRCR